jgi:hypothetical protein
MKPDAAFLELRLTPQGTVTPLPYDGGDRACDAAVARFGQHEAAGLVAMASRFCGCIQERGAKSTESVLTCAASAAGSA